MKYIFFSTHITTRQSLAVYPMSVWCLEVELLWGPSGRFGDLALPSSATPPLTWFGQWVRDVEAESSSGLVYTVLTFIFTSIPFLKVHPHRVHWKLFLGDDVCYNSSEEDDWTVNTKPGRSGHWRNPLRQNLSAFPTTSGKQLPRLCFLSGYSCCSSGLKS